MERIKRRLKIGPQRHKKARKVQYKNQNFYFIGAEEPNQPLLIRLHNWGSDYRNKDLLISSKTAELGWNYVHPDFQGANNNPNAGGSDKVIEDIDNVIDYAIEKGHVDQSKIYILGVSGGGHAGLCHFMKSQYEIHTYMAWVPITDLEAWYYESLGRKNHYYKDILAITESEDSLNVDNAHSRSPYHMETPLHKLKNTNIKLYAGIHDGYNGEVPITQSLNFYNKLAKEMEEELITPEEIIYLLGKRRGKEVTRQIEKRDVHFYKKFGNTEITIFEGGHEVLGHHAIEELLNQ